MLKSLALAAALGLVLAAPARATELQLQSKEFATPAPQTLSDTVVGVTDHHRNAGGVILGDAVGGAVAGAAVGGGVVLYERYVASNGTWDNWGRTIAIGAAIGAGVGLVFGVVDASTNADRGYSGAVVDKRESGFSAPLGQYGKRF